MVSTVRTPVGVVYDPATEWATRDKIKSHLSAQFQLARHRLALTARVILKALLKRDAKHHCHFERSLKRGRILALLQGYNRLSCHTDLVREFLLGDLAKCSEFSNLITYGWMAGIRVPSGKSQSGGGFGDIRDDQHARNLVDLLTEFC